MKKQAFNPYLPLDKYIPDGEPHVFGDRVYLFGSHDSEGGETYCGEDYEFFSAPVDDLSQWTSNGINYSSRQDTLYSAERPYMYAPDVVCGNDGRYYLYYCLSGYRGKGGYHGPISVAVCDKPDGKYEFLGHVKYEDGMSLAVLEGVAFSIKQNIEVIKSLGVNITKSKICGGGTKNKLWIQLFATILDIEIEVPTLEHGGVLGACLLAAKGDGKDIPQAFYGVKETIKPEKELVEHYEKKYHRYLKLYPLAKEI